VSNLTINNQPRYFLSHHLIHSYQYFWLLLPNFAYIFIHPVGLLQGGGLLIISLSLFFIIYLITDSWKIFYLINLPLAFLSGFISAYIIIFQIPITIGLIHSIFNTNMTESLEVMQRYILWTFASSIGFFVYLYITLFKMHSKISMRNYMVLPSIIGLFIVIYHPYLIFELHEKFNIVLNKTFVIHAYPYNIVRTTKKVIIDKQTKKNIKLNIPKISIINNNGNEIYILVIGESAREKTFTEIAKDTKWLAKTNNFIYYNDVMTQANFTSLSIDMLLTGAVYPNQVNTLPSLLHWQKAVQCTTAVISNNTSYKFNNFADISDVEGDSGVTHYTRFDHDMLPIIESLVFNSNYKKLCITIHMVGSHANYKARYDSKYEFYPVKGNKIEKMRAAYKNTIVSLQDFLKQLTDIFENIDADIMLAYTSDHGENLGEINNLFEHVTLTPTHYELMVPMLFWANNNYIKNNRTKWKKLASNNEIAISNANLVPTFLDGMGILHEINKKVTLPDSLFSDISPMDRIYVTPDMEIHEENDILK
jgi:glucan phosphoethanolaminetransferase (alkaline phosphatase superfamily)